MCAMYPNRAVEAVDLSDIEAVAINETSCQRGHAYRTLVADAARRKVLYVTEGRAATSVELFAQHLTAQGGDPTPVTSAMLRQWCTHVLRSKVEPMKTVARMVRQHFEGIVAWAQTRQTNGFLEALNGLFQAAKRKARGYTRFVTMRTVIFLIAGKLDFQRLNPHAR
jgi:transposase